MHAEASKKEGDGPYPAGAVEAGQEPECKKARLLRIAWRLLLVAPVLVSTLSSILVQWPAGPIVEKFLGGVALILFGFHCVNAKTRIRLEHWTVKRLVPVLCAELFVGLAIPLGIVSAALVLPPTWQTLLGIGIAFLIAHSCYEPLEERIYLVVEDEGLRHGTSRFEERRPLWAIWIKETIGEIKKRDHGPGYQRFLIFWVKPSWRPLLSRTRTVILYIMLGCCCMAFGASLEVGVHGGGNRPSHTKEGVTHEPSDQQGESQTVAPDEPSEETAATPDTWESSCPTLPEYGAPTWARAELNALYLGGLDLNANPPPGTAGGCTGKAIVMTTAHGVFVYTIGRNRDGEVLSVAVDSEFGPAIFLAPAAQRVIALIRQGHAPLGGFPTMTAAGGDLATITTEQGTFALVRAEKHLPGRPNVAAPYTVLPPTASSAWAGAMHEEDSWLWPLLPQPGDGLKVFLLAADASGRDRRFTIAYDPRDGTARRDQYRYYLPQPQLDQTELERDARAAR